MEGRVEVCLNATWWLVSGTYWDLNDTRVVCRQLGYPTECKLHHGYVLLYLKYVHYPL